MGNEVLSRFRENTILPSVKAIIEDLYIYYKDNEEKVQTGVYESLAKIFNIAVNEQTFNSLVRIGHMDITLSRINIYNKEYKYPVNLYEAGWYAEPLGCLGYASFNFIYKDFDALLTQLVQERKKYVNKINVSETEQEAFKLLYAFNNFLVRIIRDLQSKILADKQFIKIEKEDRFCLKVTEIYENPQTIITKRENAVNTHQVKMLIDDHMGSFEDFKGVRFNHYDINGKALNYTNFSDMTAEKLQCVKSNFAGTVLGNAIIKNSNFIECFFNETDFTGCDIEHTIFRLCQFEPMDILDDKGIKVYEFKQTCFHKSRFTDLEFDLCHLKNIDFTTSILENIIFRDSDVQGCKFTEQQMESVQFINCIGEVKIIK